MKDYRYEETVKKPGARRENIDQSQTHNHFLALLEFFILLSLYRFLASKLNKFQLKRIKICDNLVG